MQKKISKVVTNLKFNTTIKFFKWLVKEREHFPENEYRERNLLSAYIEKFNFISLYVYSLLFKIIRVKTHLFVKYSLKRYLIKISIILIIIFGLGYFLYTFTRVKYILIDKTKPSTVILPQNNTLKDYLKALAYKESKNNWKAERKNSQYWGMWQIGTLARVECNITEKKDEFLNSKVTQCYSIIRLLCKNKIYLNEYIQTRTIGRFITTESGILAMAQLCGYYPIKNFIKKNGNCEIPVDGNQEPCVNYLDMNNYDIHELNEFINKDNTINSDKIYDYIYKNNLIQYVEQ